MDAPGYPGNNLANWDGALGQRVNLITGRDGRSRAWQDWGATRSLPATKLEMNSIVPAARPVFVHVESVQPRLKPRGSWAWIAPEPGFSPAAGATSRACLHLGEHRGRSLADPGVPLQHRRRPARRPRRSAECRPAELDGAGRGARRGDAAMTVLDERPRRAKARPSIGAAALLMLLAGCPGGGEEGAGTGARGRGRVPRPGRRPSPLGLDGRGADLHRWMAGARPHRPAAGPGLPAAVPRRPGCRRAAHDAGQRPRHRGDGHPGGQSADVAGAGDIAAFCPGYAGLDADGRADFWRALVTAIARPESDFRTDASLWSSGT